MNIALSKSGKLLLLTFILGIAAAAVADTAAWWRFEAGPAGEPLPHPTASGAYFPAAEDYSGGGNALSVWDEGGAGYTYETNLGFGQVSGMDNHFCIRNIGPTPSMWTRTSAPINTITPAAFTIEATFKLANGSHRTLVGRDSYGTAPEADLAALYFQAMPNNRVAVKFCDISGRWHQAVSADNAIQTFDIAANPTGSGVPWYSMAAVSTGQTLSLYLRNVTADQSWQLVAQTDLALSSSPDTSLTAGAGDGSDWDAGNWSVGRGLFNGEHVDRALGYLDEIRISTRALAPSEFLFIELPRGDNWMGFLDGGLSLSKLSIPGTHDSGALYEPLAGTAKCQNLTIAEQLNAGVRFLDIRCRHINNTFTIHHGPVYQNMNFTDVLNAVIGFLDAHPTECVLMSVKEEYNAENVTRSFESTFDSYTQTVPGRWHMQASIPTLDAARGKIVLLRRFGASRLPKGIAATNWADNTTFTINNAAARLRVQDYYDVSSADAKWNAVQAFLNEAPTGDPATLYLNYTSGLKAGFLGIPSITTVSNTVNPRLVTYFAAASFGRYGVLPMDFADAQKAGLIFATNFRSIPARERADLNGDSAVDAADLDILCEEWLSVPQDTRTDLWPDNFVDMKDVGRLAEYWHD